jgi:hypothetical protein
MGGGRGGVRGGGGQNDRRRPTDEEPSRGFNQTGSSAEGFGVGFLRFLFLGFWVFFVWPSVFGERDTTASKNRNSRWGGWGGGGGGGGGEGGGRGGGGWGWWGGGEGVGGGGGGGVGGGWGGGGGGGGGWWWGGGWVGVGWGGGGVGGGGVRGGGGGRWWVGVEDWGCVVCERTARQFRAAKRQRGPKTEAGGLGVGCGMGFGLFWVLVRSVGLPVVGGAAGKVRGHPGVFGY